MLFDNSTHFYYKAGDKIFDSKMLAAIHSSKTGKPLTFHFHDELWDAAFSLYKFNPLVDLENLYKQRALQLRANYDYLILYFSGGADSTTILNTFLENNIKLDEIFVYIPEKILGSNLHKPNIHDTSSANMLSEWDFSIKPKLDYVRTKHPEIKIVLYDWTNTLTNLKINSDLLIKQNQNFALPNFGFSEAFSPSNIEFENKGIRVANITGIDKPFVLYNPTTDKYSNSFIDGAIATGQFQHGYGKINMDNKVFFYHAVDFPELTVAMACSVANFFKNNPQHRHLIDMSVWKNITHKERRILTTQLDKLVKAVIYRKWDPNTFQVEKPDSNNRIYYSQCDYIYRTNDFAVQQKALLNTIKEFDEVINESNKSVDANGNMIGLKIMPTKQFIINI
jgi:hypothetical protein